MWRILIDIDIVLIEAIWRQNGINVRQADQGTLGARSRF